MKLRWALLLILVVAGGSLPFALSGCRDDKPSEGAGGDDGKKGGGLAAADTPRKGKTDDSKGETRSAIDFRLPDDPGGKLVGRVIAPPERLPEKKPEPRRKPSPKGLDNPSLPLPPQEVSLPRLPESPLRPPLPRVVTPEPLFGIEESFATFPHSLSFPTQDRTRVPSGDVAIPVALPRLALPVQEKVTATDPTLDESKSAVLSAPLPSRETPVPFQRLTIPDPFEHIDTVKLPATPGPETMPEPINRSPNR